ncbi:unnamed protein product [Rangifer tarandus platyrhynchus]|uniref:Uncharacterized protein n=1 Tax=Rangifer tarandus platyrhynchus TaxID=3082113 RepID=A0AC59YF53_RANTA
MLCCLEVTRERVAGRGTGGHCDGRAGGGMDTGGRRTHLLADPGFAREAWHPSSAPEMTVMDRRTRKAAKHAPPAFQAPPSRWIAPPSRRVHGDSSSLDLYSRRRPPLGMSAAGVSCPTRSQKKRPQPLSLRAGCDPGGQAALYTLICRGGFCSATSGVSECRVLPVQLEKTWSLGREPLWPCPLALTATIPSPAIPPCSRLTRGTVSSDWC